tara:strand:- start:228 stop:959 length:732 start_codon:yes stop_codon:yes gene_type:complete
MRRINPRNEYPKQLSFDKPINKKHSKKEFIAKTIVRKKSGKEKVVSAPKEEKEEDIYIPAKCKRDSMEEQMHKMYKRDNLYETRDKEGCQEIRNRFPKKGNIQCVYKFTCLVNGKSYIGQTGNLWARLKRHLERKALENGQADLQRAIRKHGINNFTFEVLIDQKDDMLMKETESRLIMEALYVKKFNSYLNGYNTEPCTTDPVERELIREDLNNPKRSFKGPDHIKKYENKYRYMSLPYGNL